MVSFEILPQLIINGLIAGSIYALAASGFSLVYYVIKFLHFAQGAILTVSAYIFFLFLNILGVHYILSAVLAIISALLTVWLMNWLVYRPLRKRSATGIVLLIASVALLMLSASLMQALFGSSTKVLNLSKSNITYTFGFLTITFIQISIIITAIVLFLLLWFILKKTRLGKSMRALADNKEVSQIVGINPEKIYFYTFLIAAFLGGVAGILIGLEQNLYPRMGIIIIIKGFISAVVGGITSVPGAIVGGLFIGLVENLGIWFLPSGYKDVISFTILLLFLLFRPQGIFGVKKRDDT
ncbi:branched-chain amino acid ABC transporter permease [Candidatus Woesearchaeota archaeon]|mgnify:CR=1 FL=1|jgi:branched-subunit amino acid ABC-type transport system permease component|nr:branched-chain amino acid ABC transporter permease [Candidatus Woesearchaeota archaeon]MAG91800.1 branched-chain amino acid ABC transporter permease [Candidatus Woesearchaeota archaeon]|tara:strand:+ start:13576 stop:14466 length:891 start_codon:yes stop_codon:yes gene_type:complete